MTTLDLPTVPPFEVATAKASVRPSRRPSLRFRLRIGGFAALALLAVAFFARNWLWGRPVEAWAVTQGELRQSVVASGRVLSPQRVSVAARTTGRVRAIPVVAGQRVKRGQTLVVLEDDLERASLAQSSAAVAEAAAGWRRLREVSLPEAEQALERAEANAERERQRFERARDLATAGVLASDDAEEARRTWEVAASLVRSMRLEVSAQRSKGSEAALAQASLAQARAANRQAEVALAQTSIIAPADGTLIARAVEPGDVVAAGRELMVLAVDGATQMVIQVDEKNLSKLHLGQSALGSADAFGSERFAARVIYINPGIDATRGSVEVKLLVLDPPAYLRQDMTVSVDIETARRAVANTVPTGAIHELSSATPWVLVVRGGRAVRQNVTLGLRGDHVVEILRGLAVGDLVVPVATATITAGQRVRAKAPTVATPATVAAVGTVAVNP